MASKNGNNLNKLDAPFLPEEVEWRVQSSGSKNGKPWAKVLVYVSNRAIQNRLDEVCGKTNWKNEYIEGPSGGILCGISILLNGEWVTKWDGAENTKVESVKGGLSDSMKRAAVQWGIGRYLYNMGESWAVFVAPKQGQYNSKIDGKFYSWNPPTLPKWALPKPSSNGVPKVEDISFG